MLDSLIDTEVVPSYAWRDVDVIPARTLPPGALVLALSPLADERALAALRGLRARGFDLAVIDVSPRPFAGRPAANRRLAYRLWRAPARGARARYRRLGVPVVEWLHGQPVEATLEEVRRFRRHARSARV